MDYEPEIKFDRENFTKITEQNEKMREYLYLQTRTNDIYRNCIMALLTRIGGDLTITKKEYVHTHATYKLVEFVKLDGEEGTIRLKVELK